MKENIKELKLFGLALTIATSIISTRLFLANNTTGYSLIFAICIALFTLAILRPNWLGPLSKVFKTIFHLVIGILTHIVLAAVYYLVITPIRLFMYFSGKDSLGLKKSEKSSYWNKAEIITDRQNYYKQY